MKKILSILALAGCLLSAQAQFSVATTPFTRDVLRSVSDAEARAKLKALGFTETISTLVALTGTSRTNIVQVQGYFLANDGGGGEFLWVTASTAATNFGSVFLPNGQSIATPGRWERIFEGTSIDCRMWGVMGYGISDESGRFQNLLNYVMPDSTKQREITIPSASTILLASPLIIGTTNVSAVGWTFTSHIKISGDNRSVGGITSVPRFILTGTNQVGIIGQYLRGVTFRNFSIEGRNLYGGQVPTVDSRHYETNYIQIGSDVRTNRYSPHVGIIIDPFSSPVASTNRYPGLDRFYDSGDITGGSSRVKFEGINFQSFVVGAVISGAGDALNAEEIDFIACSFSANKDGIGYGQAQTKANTVQNCRFAGMHTAITCLDYGLGTGAAPNVTGGDFIVLNQIIEASASRKGFVMSGVFAEDFLSIGYSVTGSQPNAHSFIGCDFRFSGLYNAPEYHWLSGSSVNFKGCNFRMSGQFPMTFYNTGNFIAPITFDDCNFTQQEEFNTGVHKEFIVSNMTPVSNTQDYNGLIFRNSRVYKANSKIVQLDTHIVNSSITNLNGKMVMPGTTIVASGSTYQVSNVTPTSFSHTPSNIAYTNGTGTGTFEVVSPNRFKVGDAVKSTLTQTWPTGPTDNVMDLYIGYISVVNGLTNTIAGVPWSVPDNFTGATAAGFSVGWIPRFHEPTTGNVTSGSAVITNVSINPLAAWNVGDRINGTGITGGTYVTAVTSSNMTMSGNATATGAAVSLFDAIYTKVINETSIDTSAELAAIVSDETGSGSLVFGTSPTLSGPVFTDTTATTVPYLSASKVLTSSAVTPTELGYVSGVTSAIQTQLNAKIGTGDIDTSSKIAAIVGDETGTGSLVFGTSPTFAGKIILTGGTVTTSQPVINATQTWNDAGVTFSGLTYAVTDTASAAASLLLDMQVGGVSKFSVVKSGNLVIAGSLLPSGGIFGSLSFSSDGVAKLLDNAGTAFSRLQFGGTASSFPSLKRSGNALEARLADDSSYTSFVASYFSLNGDIFLRRDAADILAQRNGTTTQALRVYNTYTDASNYERLSLYFSGGVAFIGRQAAGTGGSFSVALNGSSVQLYTGDTSRWTVNSSGHFLASVDNTYDLGANGANRPRNVYVGTSITTQGLVLGTVTKTGAYTLASSDHAIRGDTTSAGFSLTLPAAASHSGRLYRIKKVSADVNTLTIQANAAELIDGSNTQTIITQYAAFVIQSNGTGWDIVGKYL